MPLSMDCKKIENRHLFLNSMFLFTGLLCDVCPLQNSEIGKYRQRRACNDHYKIESPEVSYFDSQDFGIQSFIIAGKSKEEKY